MTPPNRDPNRHPDDGALGIDGKLTGRGCDDLHGFPGPGSTGTNPATGLPWFAWPDDLTAPLEAGQGDLTAVDGAGLGDLATPKPAASRYSTTADAVFLDDLAATNGAGRGDRPAGDEAEPGSRLASEAAGRGSRIASEAAAWGDLTLGDATTFGGLDFSQVAGTDGVGSAAAVRRSGTAHSGAARGQHRRSGGGTGRPRPGWYAYQAGGPAELPSWATEVALAIERPANPGAGRRAEAMVVAKASGRVRWLAGVLDAAAEIEVAMGLRPVPGVDRIAGVRPGRGSCLRTGPALPWLTPVGPADTQARLGAAGARGLPAPLRRWRPAAAGRELSWRPSAGAVVTCDGPCGVSAQAVVALRGLGNEVAITPPPGGALVLRAWAGRRTWGVACGLVLGAAEALGLGREAGRVAARARVEGWDAVVLTGPAALDLVRAGSPGQAAPEAAAQAASRARVAALFEICLAAGGLGRSAAGSPWQIAITP